MKRFHYLMIFTALMLPACGGDEKPTDDASADPLEQVPDADAAAAEADSINADNADQALADLEKELDADQ
ncbi:MAG: hypothetical protein HQ519_11720 [Planctomycetes bacterium]|nr:hypothetical protein [Planctomycetota bacterium]NQU49307.1 hypothetical protein [Planctomycetota bacterium]